VLFFVCSALLICPDGAQHEQAGAAHGCLRRAGQPLPELGVDGVVPEVPREKGAEHCAADPGRQGRGESVANFIARLACAIRRRSPSFVRLQSRPEVTPKGSAPIREIILVGPGAH
jgi:hypothetical protein